MSDQVNWDFRQRPIKTDAAEIRDLISPSLANPIANHHEGGLGRTPAARMAKQVWALMDGMP